ncbi:TPA: hypothetical protein ACIWSX_004622 [Escherichia coli]
MKRRNYIHLIESNFLHNHYYVYINHGRIAYKSVTMLSLQPSCVKSNCQGDGDAPGRNSRGTSSPFQFPFSVFSDPIHPGITPILPKTANQPSTRFITGFMKDLSKKRIFFQFGFTRDNVG